MKITLPGSETVTLTGQTIDKLIRAGDGDAALLYLYILKTHGQKTSSEAAIALDKSKGWIASATAMLSRLGLVHLDEETSSDAAVAGAESVAVAGDSGAVAAGAESVAVAEKAGTTGTASSSTTPPPIREPRKYTESEVKDELMAGSDFSIVVDETQRRLGKILSPDELLRLLGIYNDLRMPPEVILLLITHCIKESRVTGDGRAPTIRYIEKAAFTWEREGIFTLERAEEYLKALEERKSVRGMMKNTLQIWGREFSATEKKYVDDWITMGFEAEAIAIAYDKTVLKTGKLTWAYMDTIVKNWHNKGLHTAEKVREKDGGNKRSAGSAVGASARPGAQKHGDPNREEMERMQKLLNKIKEE